MSFQRSRTIIIGFAAMLGLAVGSASAATKTVGKVWLIKEKAFEKLELDSNWDDLFIDDNIILDQWIRTPAQAALHVRFADGTELRLGASAEILINKYVYDPSGKTPGEATFTFVTGMTRIITKGIKKVDVQTPTTTIGIRGSDIIIAQLPDLGSVVQVNKGRVILTACSVVGTSRSFASACANARKVTVLAGQSAGLAPGGELVRNIAFEPDPGLREDGGLLDVEPGAGGRKASAPGPRGPGGDENPGQNPFFLPQLIESAQTQSADSPQSGPPEIDE